jgi:hypothetical protein
MVQWRLEIIWVSVPQSWTWHNVLDKAFELGLSQSTASIGKTLFLKKRLSG